MLENYLTEFNNKKENVLKYFDILNIHIKKTFKECLDIACSPSGEVNSNNILLITTVLDYLHEELNTGHWSEVPLDIRNAFLAASFIKSVLTLKLGGEKNPEALTEALKLIDLGILLGAPIKDCEELTSNYATYLTKQINNFSKNKSAVNEFITNELLLSSKKRTRDINSFEKLKGIEISSISLPTLEDFYKNYFLSQKPVKIKDSISHWPACKKWIKLEYLLSLAGDRTVPIEIGSQYSDDNWSQKLMTLTEFIENYYLGRNEVVGYLAQHNLFDQIPELRKDISIPEYCCTSREENLSESEPEINAWFGPENTISSLHFDPKDNLLAQIYGSKQIILFCPEDSKYLYPYESTLLSNTSQVDPISPNLEKFPEFSLTTPYKCLLNEGEMLYIPLKWWHHVIAIEKSFSVNFWWK